MRMSSRPFTPPLAITGRSVRRANDNGNRYLIDFVINGCHAIEVNGGCHINHEARDQRKFNAIRDDGYRLLVLEACDLDRAEEIISDYLNLSDATRLGVPA
jgi:very-short-patch-repair endonuclease